MARIPSQELVGKTIATLFVRDDESGKALLEALSRENPYRHLIV